MRALPVWLNWAFAESASPMLPAVNQSVALEIPRLFIPACSKIAFDKSDKFTTLLLTLSGNCRISREY